LELWNLANACRVFEETTDTRSGIKRREATMAWTNDQDVRWNTVETELTVGGAFYLLTAIIAGLMFVFALGDFFISWAQGTAVVRVFALAVAVLVWLIGRGLRALLS
jgi:hypothetical protein